MNIRTFSVTTLYFIAAAAILIGVFFAYKPDIERAIVDTGEKVYVAVYGWFMARDMDIPNPKRLWQPD